jgi:hypothetical protein
VKEKNPWCDLILLFVNAGIVLQAQGLSTYFVLVITGSIILAMFPYLSTTALLAIPGLLVRRSHRKTGTFPAGLGVPYFRESSG